MTKVYPHNKWRDEEDPKIMGKELAEKHMQFLKNELIENRNILGYYLIGFNPREGRRSEVLNANEREEIYALLCELHTRRKENVRLIELICSLKDGLDDYWITLPENDTFVKQVDEICQKNSL